MSRHDPKDAHTFGSSADDTARGSVSRVKVVMPSLQNGLLVGCNDLSNLVEFVIFEASVCL